ncbi:coiled-coil domain-containing protein 83 isoform X2 [Amblyraja radiata]|nr:coiled-coil domain-containing protein 83 isoform X2 [Amblyraja radiata]XP_032878398.1 coiled-coil domain-containing protein 83 isoform X2 [Amblyraja radiata]XP_032878399.1 coiled-coil domain-containing protein 83 isoform X2 [Amblyraja radiata]
MAKKKKDNKGLGDDKSTLAEAFLGFRFQVKEAAIEKCTIKLKGLNETNARSKERNEQLTKEQKEHIKNLYNLAKVQEKDLERKELISIEQVEQAMKHKMELSKQNERKLHDMQISIANVKQEILKMTVVKEYWLEYKNVGSIEHVKSIKLQEDEIHEMARCFSEMKEHFRKSLAKVKDETDRLTQEQMDEKKEIATQKALSYMGKHSRQEVKENEWLKKELKQYSAEVANIEQAVQKIEEENLEILSQLFDCQLSDLKLCGNLSKTCAVEPKGRDTTLLEGEPFEIDHRGEISAKPKSKALLAAGKEVAIMQKQTEGDEETPFRLGKSLSQNLAYLLQDDEKCLEDLECGAYEQKRLHVKGQAMLLQEAEQPSVPENKKQTEPNEAEMGWPVTGTMLRSVIS